MFGCLSRARRSATSLMLTSAFIRVTPRCFGLRPPRGRLRLMPPVPTLMRTTMTPCFALYPSRRALIGRLGLSRRMTAGWRRHSTTRSRRCCGFSFHMRAHVRSGRVGMPRPARRPLISKAGAGRSAGAGPRAGPVRRGARAGPRRRKIGRGRGEGLEGVAEHLAAASPAGVGGRRRRSRGAARAAEAQQGQREARIRWPQARQSRGKCPGGRPRGRLRRRGPRAAARHTKNAGFRRAAARMRTRPKAEPVRSRRPLFGAGPPRDALPATARSAPCFRHGAAARGQDAVQAAAGPLPPRAGRQAACGRVECPVPRARKARPRRCAGRGHCNRRRIPPGRGASSNALLRECAYI